MTDLRLAVGQFATSAQGADNVALARAAIAQAAAAGARVVLLPEYTSAWAPRLSVELADGFDTFAGAIRQAAAEHGIWVIAGAMAPHGDRAHNVAIAVDDHGAVVAEYRKVHLFDAFGFAESDVLDAGEPGAVVVEIDGWAIGLATCYDLRFPESFRALVDGGAQVFAVGAAWAAGPGKADQLRVLAQARALENTSYLLLASQCGDGRTGGSAILDPVGQPLAQASTEPELLVADLSRSRLEAVRRRIPVLTHRRFSVVSGA